MRRDFLRAICVAVGLLLVGTSVVEAMQAQSTATQTAPLTDPPATATPQNPLQNKQLTADENVAKAHATMNAMIKALGGDAWLNLKNERREGRAAAFYEGKPTGGTIEYYEFHSFTEGDRIEFTKHRDFVQIYKNNQAWEITYRGKKPLPIEQADEYYRRKRHSLEWVVKRWLNDPNSILVYEGQHLAARHLAEQVTIISPDNDAVTILTDIQSHLPLKKTFKYRDPIYKDYDTESEEYDDYHNVNGIPTAFTITRFKGEDMVSQKFLFRAGNNEQFHENWLDENAAEKKIKK